MTRNIKENNKYDESFEAKLILAENELVDKYGLIHNTLLKMTGIKSKINWEYENIIFNQKIIAKFTFEGKTLVLYLALNPSTLDNKKYSFEDVGDECTELPLKLLVKSDKSVKNAVALINQLLTENQVTKTRKVEETNYLDKYQIRSVDELIKLGLVKDTEAKNIKTKASKDEKTVGIKFVVKILDNTSLNDVKNLYIIGNIAELGNWNPQKGIKLNNVNENTFEATVYIPINSSIEFKISKDKTWLGVEKGIFKEEIKNHAYIINKELIIENKVYNFR